jgi:hypothetical protein
MSDRNHGSGKAKWWRIGVIGTLVVVLGAGLYFAWRQYRSSRPEWAVVTCDMETVVDEQETKYFKTEGALLSNGFTQSEGAARSGKYSTLVFNEQEFGATLEWTDVHPGDLFEASIWRKSPDNVGYFVASGNWDMYKEATLSGKQEGEWEELVVKFRVPSYIPDGVLKFYAWNPDKRSAFFDDMTVRHFKAGRKRPSTMVLPEDSIAILDLEVGSKGMSQLEEYRMAAMERGMLNAQDEGWVKMDMGDGKKTYTGKLRLKGDWTDHLMGDKWSFRIALDSAQAWRGMVTFSVQNPRTRWFLSEWVFHEWLKKEDLLTPRYGFVELKVNGVSRGLYAYEEHFERQLATANSRQPGPILKYDEEGLWEAQGMAIHQELPDFENHIHAYKSADIQPFSKKSAMQDDELRKQVEIAQQLIHQYKTGQKTVWDLFDAQKVARYYAIIDLMNAQHAFIWHNQRWYYNPVLSRLEPIGFDGFTEGGPLTWIDKPFIGYSRNVRYMAPGYRELMFERFFHDIKFLKLYVAALMKYSAQEYLESFLDEMESRLVHYEEVLQREWADYRFNRKAFLNHARSIRLLLYPMKRSSVKAHVQGKTEEGVHYRVYNYHCLPVVLKGVGDLETKMDAPFNEEKVLDAYNNEFPAEYTDIYSEDKGKFVFFEVPGIDSLFTAEIIPWEEPQGLTPEQSLFRDLKLATNSIYTVDSSLKRVTFQTGKHQSGKDLLFPAGWQVWFEKGVELDLIQGAKFISKSQVLLFGREDAPIRIYSSDGSAGGFSILQAEGKSEFHYVAFDNLDALRYKGWNLSGAVTLYESECLFSHVRFVNSRAQDALSLVRCIFTFVDSYIGHAQGDGLHADYCTGSVTNGGFSEIGEDGMDCSGSQLFINSATLEGVEDKAVSMGEESKATIAYITIRNSKGGIVSHDLSHVEVRNAALLGVKQGFAVFNKKPEYGPATMTVLAYKAEGGEQLYEVQEGSKLTLLGKDVEGPD